MDIIHPSSCVNLPATKCVTSGITGIHPVLPTLAFSTDSHVAEINADCVVDRIVHANVSASQNLHTTAKETMMHVLRVIMVQHLQLKVGFGSFGDVGEKAVSKELIQHHDMQSYFPCTL